MPPSLTECGYGIQGLVEPFRRRESITMRTAHLEDLLEFREMLWPWHCRHKLGSFLLAFAFGSFLCRRLSRRLPLGRRLLLRWTSAWLIVIEIIRGHGCRSSSMLWPTVRYKSRLTSSNNAPLSRLIGAFRSIYNRRTSC